MQTTRDIDPLPKEVIDFYLKRLEGFSCEQISNALTECIDDSKWWPSIADIKQRIKPTSTMIRDRADDVSRLVLDKIIEKIDNGYMPYVHMFDEPEISLTLQSIPDMAKLVSMTGDERDGWRATFADVYRKLIAYNSKSDRSSVKDVMKIANNSTKRIGYK